MSRNRIELRAPDGDIARWRTAAALQGMGLQDWIRDQLNEVALDKESLDMLKKRANERKRSGK